MTDIEIYCDECDSTNTIERRDGSGLCKCLDCGAYFEAGEPTVRVKRTVKAFDDDERE
jgi:ribosomal protein L37AE/L43A